MPEFIRNQSVIGGITDPNIKTNLQNLCEAVNALTKNLEAVTKELEALKGQKAGL